MSAVHLPRLVVVEERDGGNGVLAASGHYVQHLSRTSNGGDLRIDFTLAVFRDATHIEGIVEARDLWLIFGHRKLTVLEKGRRAGCPSEFAFDHGIAAVRVLGSGPTTIEDVCRRMRVRILFRTSAISDFDIFLDKGAGGSRIEEIQRLTPLDSIFYVSAGLMHPEGPVLAASSLGNFSVFDFHEAKWMSASSSQGPIYTLATFSFPEHRLLAVLSGDDRALRVVDVQSLTELCFAYGHSTRVSCVCATVSALGMPLIYSCSLDSSLCLWTLSEGELMLLRREQMVGCAAPRAMVILKDGSMILGGASGALVHVDWNDAALQFLRAADNPVVKSFNRTVCSTIDEIVSLDGRGFPVAVRQKDGKLVRIGEQCRTIKLPSIPRKIASSPSVLSCDGRLMFHDSRSVWSLENHQHLQKLASVSDDDVAIVGFAISSTVGFGAGNVRWLVVGRDDFRIEFVPLNDELGEILDGEKFRRFSVRLERPRRRVAERRGWNSVQYTVLIEDPSGSPKIVVGLLAGSLVSVNLATGKITSSSDDFEGHHLTALHSASRNQLFSAHSSLGVAEHRIVEGKFIWSRLRLRGRLEQPHFFVNSEEFGRLAGGWNGAAFRLIRMSDGQCVFSTTSAALHPGGMTFPCLTENGCLDVLFLHNSTGKLISIDATPWKCRYLQRSCHASEIVDAAQLPSLGNPSNFKIATIGRGATISVHSVDDCGGLSTSVSSDFATCGTAGFCVAATDRFFAAGGGASRISLWNIANGDFDFARPEDIIVPVEEADLRVVRLHLLTAVDMDGVKILAALSDGTIRSFEQVHDNSWTSKLEWRTPDALSAITDLAVLIDSPPTSNCTFLAVATTSSGTVGIFGDGDFLAQDIAVTDCGLSSVSIRARDETNLTVFVGDEAGRVFVMVPQTENNADVSQSSYKVASMVHYHSATVTGFCCSKRNDKVWSISQDGRLVTYRLSVDAASIHYDSAVMLSVCDPVRIMLLPLTEEKAEERLLIMGAGIEVIGDQTSQRS